MTRSFPRDPSSRLVRISPPGNDASATLDVVFVHGLGGSIDTTWGAGESTWLHWLSDDHPGAVIWSLGYPAAATKWTDRGSGMSLPDRVPTLIDRLRDNGIGSRKVAFVCHSLGGLIVKQMLRHAEGVQLLDIQTISTSTMGVAFLATPHSGSTLATFIGTVGPARPTLTTLSLRAHCSHLEELGNWYRQNAGALGIQTVAYRETRKTRRWFGAVLVVNPTSANPGITDCVTTPIDADHSSIAKPQDRDADVYLGISRFITRLQDRAASEQDAKAESGLNSLESAITPPADLVEKIREIDAMKDMGLITSGEVAEVRTGILYKHYGILQ
ncbi:pimeloyl-ACP methyl ester carboxylesterase [Microbacterium sp. BE35]|uniref:esterase/lipase family protein n=1 Tax=Microbacterium sp. BE35 TaxID=2817773 RepID=UPI002854AD56|nr:alpha/beta fold hydrolase [Microbacterium sp. BE35]MDR7191006.1 pimeloyl-ACP methyl ester carboxylesterase [Microbacterium sp. BE35]